MVSIDRIKHKFTWLWHQIKMFNLFDSNSNNLAKQHTERQTTRLYIILLATASVILLSYTIATEETRVYTIEKPPQETYEKLYAKYSNTMTCMCSEISIPYSEFIRIQASFHQVCSSSFVLSDLSTQLAMIKHDIRLYPIDFMLMSTGHLQWLSTLCTLSRLIFFNQLAVFLANPFVNNKLLAHQEFEVQGSQLADAFINDIQFYFARGIKQTLEAIGITQAISATSSVIYKLPIVTTPQGRQVRMEAANYFSSCSCVSEPISCSDEAAFYSYNPTNDSFHPVFKIPGMRIACNSLQSVLKSNLDCWYSSECYQTVRFFNIHYFNQRSRTFVLGHFILAKSNFVSFGTTSHVEQHCSKSIQFIDITFRYSR